MKIIVDEGRVRIDKWLWASRFFKTRPSASQAVTGGHVHVNGMRVKPSRMIAPGEVLRIRRGELEFTVVVIAVSDRRGPAAVARDLYTETEESKAAREKQSEERKLFAGQEPSFPHGAPTKRDRRLIRRVIGKGEWDNG